MPHGSISKKPLLVSSNSQTTYSLASCMIEEQIVFGGKSADKTSIAGFLHCLGNVEEEMGVLFFDLSEKGEIVLVKQQLLEISNDCKKHAALFWGLSKRIESSTLNMKDCQKKLGNITTTVERVSLEIAKKEKLTVEELHELISILEVSSVEEQFIQIQAKTLQMMSSEINRLYGVNFEEFEEQLMGASRDEENHRILLENIRESLETEMKKNLDSLKVKYLDHADWVKTEV